jgi:hypothetical protein
MEQNAHLEFQDWKIISCEFFYASEVHKALVCSICSKGKGLAPKRAIQDIFILILYWLCLGIPWNMLSFYD